MPHGPYDMAHLIKFQTKSVEKENYGVEKYIGYYQKLK